MKAGKKRKRNPYYELDTDVNLRLSKISIIPQILEIGRLDQYKMTFIFDNMAKNLIHEIEISASKGLDADDQKTEGQIVVSIEGMEETLDVIEPRYYLQDGKPVIQFSIKIEKSPLKEMFAGFYYYFSQFSLDIPKMELKMGIDIRYGDSNKDRTTRNLLVDLMPTPMIEYRKKYLEFSEEEYEAESYEILISNYKVERDKKVRNKKKRFFHT